jgi:hypothetical protein
MVDEEDQLFTCDALGVGGPVPPLEFLRDDGLVTVADEFEFLIFVVKDFQEEHPAELLQPLGVAGDSTVFCRMMLRTFLMMDEMLGISSGYFIKFVGQGVDGGVIGRFASEGANDLHGPEPSLLRGSRRMISGFSKSSNPSSEYLSSKAETTLRARSPYFVK